MGENVVWIKFCDALRRSDGFIETSETLKHACEPVHRFGKVRVGCKRAAIFVDRAFVFAVGDEVEGGIIMVFGLLSGGLGNMKRRGQPEANFTTCVLGSRQYGWLTGMAANELEF